MPRPGAANRHGLNQTLVGLRGIWRSSYQEAIAVTITLSGHWRRPRSTNRPTGLGRSRLVRPRYGRPRDEVHAGRIIACRNHLDRHSPLTISTAI